MDVAEFAKARGIDKEPAFAWWVPYTLRKRDTILSVIKKRISKTSQNMALRFLQVLSMPMKLIRRMEITFQEMPSKKKCIS